MKFALANFLFVVPGTVHPCRRRTIAVKGGTYMQDTQYIYIADTFN